MYSSLMRAVSASLFSLLLAGCETGAVSTTNGDTFLATGDERVPGDLGTTGDDRLLADADGAGDQVQMGAGDTGVAGDGVGQGDPNPGAPVRLGILGDSNTDEYRANDNRGGLYAATTFNWLEMHVITGHVDAGPLGTWGEPRRQGYEYNWARSGATAASMISSGQHTGLAAQIAAGEVTHVVVYIGTNDLKVTNNTYQEIYDGSLSGAALQSKIDGIVANVTTAVDTLQIAGDADIVIANLADPGLFPPIQLAFPDSVGRQRVTDAVAAINLGLSTMATARGVLVWDQIAYTVEFANQLDSNFDYDMDGELINAAALGDEPHFLQLEDTHAGTVANGLLGNAILDTFRDAGRISFPPLSDQEILELAGIR